MARTEAHRRALAPSDREVAVAWGVREERLHLMDVEARQPAPDVGDEEPELGVLLRVVEEPGHRLRQGLHVEREARLEARREGVRPSRRALADLPLGAELLVRVPRGPAAV